MAMAMIMRGMRMTMGVRMGVSTLQDELILKITQEETKKPNVVMMPTHSKHPEQVDS